MFKMLLKLCICAWGYMHVSAVSPEARGKGALGARVLGGCGPDVGVGY